MDSPSVQKVVVIRNAEGMHARPATMLARLALKYQSTIELICDGQRVDAKSILHLLTLGAVQGTELTVETRGVDAEEALDAIVRLVESEFAADEKIGQESAG
jgi:phosphocarrier protein HPr